MKAKLLKNNGIWIDTESIVTVFVQDRITRSAFILLTENFGLWFTPDKFELIE